LNENYGLSEMDAYRRISAQLPLREKEAYADYVLRNNGTLGEFQKLVIETWERTLREYEKK